MASFTEDFNRADENIEAGDWTALDSSNGTAAVALVRKTRAVAADPSKTTVAWHSGTVPTTVAQEAGAYVTSLVEGANCWVQVGVLGKSATGSFSTNPLGVWARLSWLADDVRRLSLHRHLPGETSATQLGYVDLILAGAVEADGFEGVMDGTLGVRQRLRVVVDTDDAGLRARAYVNSEDDDKPTLTALIDQDYAGTGDATQPYGKWWIGWGPSAGTVGDQSVSGVYGLDFAPDTDIDTQDVRVDQPTLAMMRREIAHVFLGSTQVSMDEILLDRAIRDSVEEIVNIHGDAAWFMRRTESVAVTVDSNGYATLEPRMRRVLWMKDAYDATVTWKLVDHGSNGAPRVYMPQWLSGTYSIHFILRHVQVSDPHHVLPIPREYQEVLTQAACMRLASHHGQQDKYLRHRAEYDRLMGTMAIDLGRTHQQRRVTAMPARIDRPYDRYLR